jgi:hypothetical protein
MPGSYSSLPEKYKIVQLYCGQGTTAEVTTDAVSLKNAQMCWLIVNLDTTASSACLVTPMRATAVALTAGAVLANVVPIWVNVNVAATDTLARMTAALNYTTIADAFYKQLVFEIDPANLGGAFDCVYMTIGALAATEALCVEAIIETRYPQAIPPTAITD